MRTATTATARVKLALIPVLGLVLVYILATSPAPDDAAPSSTLLETPDPQPAGGESIATAENDPSAAVVPAAEIVTLPPPKDWPSLSLGEVLENNPFAWPKELASPAQITDSKFGDDVSADAGDDPQRQELLDQLASAGVSAFYESNQGAIALVGTRVLRVGDVIEGKLRVLRIDPEQVTYEPVEP